MGNQNQIKSKLLEMEGGKFQRLCDDWLYRKGYENINPIGMMNTTDRVVKGTPDCLFMQKNGKYIFSEYTVQQERLANKLKDPQTALPTPPIVQGFPVAFFSNKDRLFPEHSIVLETIALGIR